MKVVKKLYSDSPDARMASRIFDDVLMAEGLPDMDLFEFHVGHGFTHIGDNSISMGISLDDPLLAQRDRESLKTLILMEFSRISVRRKLGDPAPRIIEDVLAGRDMIKSGRADPLCRLFFEFVISHKIMDIRDYARINVPWLAFVNDKYYSEMFRQYAKQRARQGYELKSRKLFNALSRDMWRGKNLQLAINAHEALFYAGDKV